MSGAQGTTFARSADGTPIAWSVQGRGPAIVIVDCVMAWRSSTPQPDLPAALASHFTVYTYDRRGKGESGDTAPYAVDRECEDLAAVVEATGESAAVYGFSSGGLLALVAAARGLCARGVVAMEPPVGGPQAPDRRKEFEDILSSDPRAANEFFMTEIQGIPAHVRAQFPPLDEAQLRAVPTITHELTMLAEIHPADLAGNTLPTLLLHSDQTAPFLLDSAAQIDAALPNSLLRPLPGHWHGVADELIVGQCTDFLTD